jgi:imidazoleglycerol-phosphate dehydratase
MAGRREATVTRNTAETSVEIAIDLDGTGVATVSTGILFFDHMLEQLGRHGHFDLTIEASGDLAVDAHHTVEDVGISLGEAFAEALGDKVGIRRYASLALPLDEALVEVALDISGRPYLAWGISLPVDTASPAIFSSEAGSQPSSMWSISFPLNTPGIGDPPFPPQLAEEFFRAFVNSAKVTLHVRSPQWTNPHHVLEAAFKALARCLHDATRIESSVLPSTKGKL